MRTAPRLRHVLLKALHDQGRVVTEVSGLRLLTPQAARLFPAVHAASGGWPWTKLVLCGGDPTAMWPLRGSLRDYVAHYPTLTEAVARLDERPLRVRRTHEFACSVHAPRLCRTFVEETCAVYGLPELVTESARLAASELVTNSVEHARSPTRVALDLDDNGFGIAVRDHSSEMPVRREFDATTGRGRGLAFVELLSDAWGVTPEPDGKIVWLRFKRSW